MTVNFQYFFKDFFSSQIINEYILGTLKRMQLNQAVKKLSTMKAIIRTGKPTDTSNIVVEITVKFVVWQTFTIAKIPFFFTTFKE